MYNFPQLSTIVRNCPQSSAIAISCPLFSLIFCNCLQLSWIADFRDHLAELRFKIPTTFIAYLRWFVFVLLFNGVAPLFPILSDNPDRYIFIALLSLFVFLAIFLMPFRNNIRCPHCLQLSTIVPHCLQLPPIVSKWLQFFLNGFNCL